MATRRKKAQIGQSSEDAASAARALVASINAHDVGLLISLLTGDHVLIDGLGARMGGLEKLKKAWTGYFSMVPDYWIRIDQELVSGTTVVLLGTAGGTLAVGGRVDPENRWSVPAAWRAVVASGRIVEWQIYADNEPIRAHMRRAGLIGS